MKALTLAAGVATLLVPLSAATGAIYTVGGPLAESCYEAALARDSRSSAVDACSRAIAVEPLANPDLVATYVNRGIIHMVGGRFAKADADFDRALSMDNDLADAWLNKGFLRIKQGRGRDALPMLQNGIDRGPRRQALAYFARGVAHEQAGNYRSAYNDLQRARQLEPQWALPGEWLAHYQVRNP